MLAIQANLYKWLSQTLCKFDTKDSYVFIKNLLEAKYYRLNYFILNWAW